MSNSPAPSGAWWLPRAREFEVRYGVILEQRRERRVGEGRDGVVLFSDRATVVKFFHEADPYLRERGVYLNFQSRAITEILGHQVPRYCLHDDEMLAIEMSVVAPPFFLDFASTYAPEEVPDFPPEVWEEWEQEKVEQFGDHWPHVQRLVNELRRLVGVVIIDIHPGNIRFEEEA